MMALKTRPLGEYSFNYFRFPPLNLHCFPDSIGPTSLTTHLDRLKRGFSSDLFSVVLFSNHNHRFFPRPFQCFHRYFFCDTLDCDPWVFVVFSCSSIGPNGVRLFLFSSKNFSYENFPILLLLLSRETVFCEPYYTTTGRINVVCVHTGTFKFFGLIAFELGRLYKP